MSEPGSDRGAGPTGQPSSRAVISLLIGIAAAVALVGIGAAIRAALGSSGSSGHVITYHVAGGPASVSYGPAGSSLGHGAPMDITAPAGNAAYYSIWAQLSGAGAVTCAISVDGQVISQASASSDYGVAQCEIAPDGAGGWKGLTGP